MSKKIDFRLSKVAKPPDGVAWLWHTVDLLTSPAWRARSDQLARLLDLLEVEHLKNGGAENGHIHQTYSQIQAGGIARKYICATIGEGEGLGLIVVQHGLRRTSTESYMSKFRLAYLPAKVIDPAYQGGKPYYIAPTDEWKRVTADRAKAVAERAASERSAASGRKNGKCRPQREPKQFPNGYQVGSPTGTGHPEDRRKPGPENPLPVPQREHPSISWGDTGNQTHTANVAKHPKAVSVAAPIDTDQPTIRQAGRQRHGQDEPNHDAPSLLDLIDAQKAKAEMATVNQASPIDRLRECVRAKLATSAKGTQKTLALLIGVSPPHLSNFLGGRFGLTNRAAAMLQDWLDGRIVTASPKDAAA